MPQPFRIFAYGTLRIPEVMRAVTGADAPGQPAVLRGYARYRLRHLPYPGLRLEDGAETHGMLYTFMDARALARLDGFEDDFYQRETLTVFPASGSAVDAEVYVIPPRHYSLLERRPWDLEEFRRMDLPGFLARCRGPGR